MASTAVRAFVRRLVRQHRLADDVADGEDRRLRRPALLIDFDEAARVHLDAGPSSPGMLEFGRRPTATSTRSNICSSGCLSASRSPSSVTRMPSARLLIRTTLVLSSTASHIVCDPLGEHVDEVAVGSGQQSGRHLDDRHLVPSAA